MVVLYESHVSGGFQSTVYNEEPLARSGTRPHREEKSGAEREPADTRTGPWGAAVKHWGWPHSPSHLPDQVKSFDISHEILTTSPQNWGRPSSATSCSADLLFPSSRQSAGEIYRTSYFFYSSVISCLQQTAHIAVKGRVQPWSAVMIFLCRCLEKMERHLLKILSHHILVCVSQHEDMIQADPGTYQGSRMPVCQQLRYGSNSNMLSWTTVTVLELD